MVELSTFVGQLIIDLAHARTTADYAAASISEQYHADPFVKTLPIPHYIIDEAEIEVPVMVVGISKRSEQFIKQRDELCSSIQEKLPIILLRSYKFNFIREHEILNRQAEGKREAEDKIREEANRSAPSQRRRYEKFKYEFSDAQLDAFSNSAKELTDKMVANTKAYLDNYNYEIVKILDMTEDFSSKLQHEIRIDMRGYKEEEKPYLSDETIAKSSKYVGNLMFFEFKRIMQSNAAVNIDINTVQMNEYATKDCLMHIKLKIKEQDLNLIVEGGENDKEKRYLSLT